MKKTYLILLALLVVALAALLPGCDGNQDELEGMYVVTFELNGGTLDIKSSSTNTNINYAYQPGSLLIDPTNKDWTYKLTRPGYIFTGWYTSQECLENQKWDFATGTINTERMSLYAGWEKEIVFTYSVCYTDESGATQVLGKYKVSEGAVFEDYQKHAGKREGFTPSGFFSDAACTTAWDFSTKHPGGTQDTDIQIFVDYIPGDWIIVGNYEELKNAAGRGNIYLTADIDCGGQELSFGRDFSHILQGNGHKISNFVVEKAGTALIPSISIFQNLSEGAQISNVTFENVAFNFFNVGKATKIKVAALAKEATGCVVENVSISGILHTDYEGELPRLEEAFFEEGSNGEITNLTVEITVSVETES